jgi:hypothetical protein
LKDPGRISGIKPACCSNSSDPQSLLAYLELLYLDFQPIKEGLPMCSAKILAGKRSI